MASRPGWEKAHRLSRMVLRALKGERALEEGTALVCLDWIETVRSPMVRWDHGERWRWCFAALRWLGNALSSLGEPRDWSERDQREEAWDALGEMARVSGGSLDMIVEAGGWPGKGERR